MNHWTKFVRGTQRRGVMNKTEAEYAEHLYSRKLAGEVLEYWFEAMTFKLADGCRYTPDFIVFLADGTLEAHEVKGFWSDDAKVKIKVAAGMFPFRFVAMTRIAKKHGGGWKETEF